MNFFLLLSLVLLKLWFRRNYSWIFMNRQKWTSSSVSVQKQFWHLLLSFQPLVTQCSHSQAPTYYEACVMQEQTLIYFFAFLYFMGDFPRQEHSDVAALRISLSVRTYNNGGEILSSSDVFLIDPSSQYLKRKAAQQNEINPSNRNKNSMLLCSTRYSLNIYLPGTVCW